MIKMNCAALSRELVESELFGHERGAFTGAIARREGKFEAADGGTLFLDEVGDMPLETQAKLLRAIQEKEFERVGGNQPIKVDVRAARRHQSGSRGGGARGHASARISTTACASSSWSIPPLAERREDIPLLIDHFLQATRRSASAARRSRSRSAALRACIEHEWNGNVRELRSAVEQALLLAPGAEIDDADLVRRHARRRGGTRRVGDGAGDCRVVSRGQGPPWSTPSSATSCSTRCAATAATSRKAAEEVGMYRQNFQQKMRELGISADDARRSRALDSEPAAAPGESSPTRRRRTSARAVVRRGEGDRHVQFSSS